MRMQAAPAGRWGKCLEQTFPSIAKAKEERLLMEVY